MGRTMSGLDCLGLIISFYRDVRLDLSKYDKQYEHGWELEDPETLISNFNLVTGFKSVDQSRLELYDLLVFSYDGVVDSHFGIVVDHKLRTFIHCIERAGVSVTKLSHPYWGRCLTGAYRWAARL